MSAQIDAMFPRQPHRAIHDDRIAGVITAGDVGRRDQRHQRRVVGNRVRAETLAEIRIPIPSLPSATRNELENGCSVADDIGSTILPWSAANAVRDSDEHVAVLRIVKPSMNVKISLCVSDQFPLSEPALAVNDILAELAHSFAASDDAHGVQKA
ncbi:hypothetical protein [Rhizobium alarense]|uniref:hypothetical protein n=1 Tax=Rhizobium alarense TaxID=2846851 RepID=UPI002E343D80|nr:hypothetical protein [Rhizobium alarense]